MGTDGRGSLRTEVHGFDGSRQAGELRSDDRWSMRSGPSCRPEEEQEVYPIVRRRVHTFDPSLQEARGVCRVLGSGRFRAALKWSQMDRVFRAAIEFVRTSTVVAASLRVAETVRLTAAT